jgi:Holliday junction resolvase RusA-like endonuclease
MVKARKVLTPGSKPLGQGVSPGRGRPKKKKMDGRPQKYRRNHNKENLLQALKEVKDKRMSLGQAAKEFQVPKTTLYDRVNERVSDKSGRPTVLSEVEEALLVERLLVLGEWGFPLTRRDLQNLIKMYLDGLDRSTIFKNNQPGRDFIKGRSLYFVAKTIFSSPLFHK